MGLLGIWRGLMDKKNNKYLSLILIVLSSIGTTILIFELANFLRLKTLPFYENCYEVFKNIDKITNTLFYIDLFYILFFIVYFILFIVILIKVLKIKNMKNLYTTVIILTIFNSILLGISFYSKVEMRKVSLQWCELTKDGCENAYKVIHDIDDKSSKIIQLDMLQTCFDNSLEYFEKSLKVLKNKNNKE